MSRQSDSNSVQKLCRILRVLSTPQPLRLTDVCLAADLNKATALRLLAALGEEGFVRRDPDTKRFSLGDDALALGIAMQGRDHVRDRARPWLVKLAAVSGDSIILSTRSGIESICLDREFGSYPIRANYLDIGTRRPLGVGAGSMALLAWLPEDEAAAILDLTAADIEARYPKLTRAIIEKELVAARQRGHTQMLDIIVDKMGGIAVPILGPNGAPVAAISLAALSERLTSRLDLLVPALREAATALSTPQAHGPGQTTDIGAMLDPSAIAPPRAAKGRGSASSPAASGASKAGAAKANPFGTGLGIASRVIRRNGRNEPVKAAVASSIPGAPFTFSMWPPARPRKRA
ncbi:MAG: IclR family transcriptional regulator [Burkholderiaceae bacterium]